MYILYYDELMPTTPRLESTRALRGAWFFGLRESVIISTGIRNRISSTILLCLATWILAGAAQESPRDILQPSMLGNKSYTEIYTLTAENDGGTFIQVQFTLTNLGTANKNAACKVLVLHPAQAPWNANERFTEKEWRYTDTPNPALTIGANAIAVLGDKLSLRASVGGADLAIVIFRAPAPVKPPNTDFPRGASGKFYDFEILVPWSAMQATLQIPGTPVRHLKGFGLLERSRSVGTTRDICRGWMTFRGHQGPDYFLANFRLPPHDNTPAAGWIWRTGDPGPVAVTGFDVKSDSSMVNGKKIRSELISVDRTFTIASREPMYSYSFVNELGAITGYLVKMVVGKPVTTYYDARVRFGKEQTWLPGVLELMDIE